MMMQPEFCIADHPKSIPVKFGEILPSGLGDVV